MPDHAVHPVETILGVLSGRDVLMLDQLTMDMPQGVLHLTGTINGALLAQPRPHDLAYSLTFFGVLAVHVIELDSWHHDAASSFDDVRQSQWQAQLGGKVTAAHRHYRVQTYDDVLEVICQRFDLTITARIDRQRTNEAGEGTSIHV